MDLSNLTPAVGSVKKSKRIGRGQGSGRGGTSTRGHKGQKSRSGYSRKKGFEGGQMPLQRRVPKFGFTNPNRKVFQALNLGDIQKLYDSKKVSTNIDLPTMIELGLINTNEQVKILAKGTYSAKLIITAHKCSSAAMKLITDNGGEFVPINKTESKS
jgi:large subunit ribosomal protein L15